MGIKDDLLCAVESLSPGMMLSEVALNGPVSAEAKKYLGLGDADSFFITQIPARLILLEVFSVYCPHCQSKAPTDNEIYKIIAGNEDLNRKVKMIGVGAGNTLKEVDLYRSKFRVKFPLFPDPSFEIYEKLGKPRTPSTILVTNAGKVLLAHQGRIADAEAFVQNLKSLHEDP